MCVRFWESVPPSMDAILQPIQLKHNRFLSFAMKLQLFYINLGLEYRYERKTIQPQNNDNGNLPGCV